MSQQGFGTILRTARERKGIDFNVAARRLRIRPDILQAIEDMNFAAMPPRGYSRNMINGYARYLGLNATDITRLYLDQLKDYQQHISANNARPTGIDMSAAPNNTRIPHRQGRTGTIDAQRGTTRSQRRQTAQRDTERTVQNTQRSQATGRTQNGYASQVDPRARMQRTSTRGQSAVGSHRNEGIPPTGNAYTNFYSGPAQRSKLPFIIAGAVVLLIIIIIVCVFVFGGKGSAEQEVATMPVTGVSNSTQEASDTVATSTATAPTNFTFEYNIPSSTTSWVEVWVDGNPEIAESVTGPSKKSFTCSGTLEFVCANPTGVTATQDGKALDLTPDSSGVVSMTIEFSDVLAQWQKDHPGAATSTASASTSSSSASSSSSSTSSSTTSTQ